MIYEINEYNSNVHQKCQCKITHIIFLFVLILYSFFLINSAWGYSFSNSNNLYLTTEAGIGFIQGTIGEYVYDNNTTLSRLNWNLTSLWYDSFSLVLVYNFIFAGVQLHNAINTGIVGTIDDSDWTDENNPDIKTHYSKHDNYIERYNSYNSYAGLLLDIDNIICFTPHIGFLYRSIKMSARNGYLEYPPGSPKIPVYGVGIIYEQIYYIPYLSFSSQINVTDTIAISSGISFSLFAFAEDIDNHVHRNPGDDIDFYGDYDGIIYFNAHAGCTFLVNEAIKISIGLLYEYVPEQKGDTYYINTSTGIKSQVFKNSAGIKYSVYSLQFSLLYTLTLL